MLCPHCHTTPALKFKPYTHGTMTLKVYECCNTPIITINDHTVYPPADLDSVLNVKIHHLTYTVPDNLKDTFLEGVNCFRLGYIKAASAMFTNCLAHIAGNHDGHQNLNWRNTGEVTGFVAEQVGVAYQPDTPDFHSERDVAFQKDLIGQYVTARYVEPAVKQMYSSVMPTRQKQTRRIHGGTGVRHTLTTTGVSHTTPELVTDTPIAFTQGGTPQ